MKRYFYIDNGNETELSKKQVKSLQKRDLVYFCDGCKKYHSDNPLHIIALDKLVDGEQLYWSNESGWGRFHEADIFGENDKETLNLPIEGLWASL